MKEERYYGCMLCCEKIDIKEYAEKVIIQNKKYKCKKCKKNTTIIPIKIIHGWKNKTGIDLTKEEKKKFLNKLDKLISEKEEGKFNL